MTTHRIAIHVAYCVTFRGGRNYHARAYASESGFPGLPDGRTLRTGNAVANDPDSAGRACREAVARLLTDDPEAQMAPVFFHSRIDADSIDAAPVVEFPKRNFCVGVAREYVREASHP